MYYISLPKTGLARPSGSSCHHKPPPRSGDCLPKVAFSFIAKLYFSVNRWHKWEEKVKKKKNNSPGVDIASGMTGLVSLCTLHTTTPEVSENLFHFVNF